MNGTKGRSTQIWLDFFNTYLYEQGLITELERNQMINKISSITSDVMFEDKNSKFKDKRPPELL